jgi:hypothetical protein
MDPRLTNVHTMARRARTDDLHPRRPIMTPAVEQMTELEPATIVRDPETQPRETHDEGAVERNAGGRRSRRADRGTPKPNDRECTKQIREWGRKIRDAHKLRKPENRGEGLEARGEEDRSPLPLAPRPSPLAPPRSLVPRPSSLSEIELESIVRDAEIQPRGALDDDAVEQYAEAMREGEKFPPVVVYQEGDVYRLSQGFHRCAAAEKAGFRTILAEVRQGTRQEALWDAAGSNREHDTVGLRRTNADKRRAVLMALEADPEQSDRAIADHVGVSPPMVGPIRATCKSFTPDRRTGIDGKSYPAPAGREPDKSRPATAGREPGDDTDANPHHDPSPGQMDLLKPRMPIIVRGDAPASPMVPGVRTRACHSKWIDSLIKIINEVKEFDGIEGSTYGLSVQEKEHLRGNLVYFCDHAKQWISFIEENNGQAQQKEAAPLQATPT